MRRIKNKLISLLLIMAFALGNFPISALANEKTNIKVGFFLSTGFQEINESGEYSGASVELLSRIRRYSDLAYEYVRLQGDSSKIRAALQNGDVDLLVGINKTDERELIFDFSKPIWNMEIELAVRDGNTKIISGEYESYNNMRIGVWAGDSSITLLEEFSKKRGFSYSIRTYSTIDDVNRSLMNGSVDAILRNNMNSSPGAETLDVIQVEPSYIAVKEGNTKLLGKINEAINQLDRTEPNWRREVIYSKDSAQKGIWFTAKEKEIIQKYTTGGDVLRVSANVEELPYSYAVDGRLRGILPDLFVEAIAVTGMNYEFVVAKDREDYTRKLWNGEIDICLDANDAKHLVGNMPSIVRTQSYQSVSIAELTKKDFNGQIKRVALIEGHGFEEIPNIEDTAVEKAIYKTKEEAVEAVIEGKCDAAYMTLYSAVSTINNDKKNILSYKPVVDSAFNYYMGVCEVADNELAGILVKCLNQVSEADRRRIVNIHVQPVDGQVSASEFFGVHPEYVIFAGFLIFASIIIVVAAVWHSRALKYNAALELENAKNKVLEQELRLSTELERAQRNYTEGLQNAKALAEEASAAKSRFLFNVSHDIRTPMNAIIGFTRKARKNVYDPRIVDECLSKVEESNEYLLNLVNDVLDLARIESDKMELEESLVNVAENADNMTGMFMDMLGDKQLTILTDFSGVRDKWVWADELRFRQIITNIVTNSIKYTNPGGQIKYTICQKSCDIEGRGTFEYVIEDNGIGMTEEYLNHIFELFSRADMSSINKTEGTGLGMAIVKSLVSLMGGDINISSKLGEGTKVTITISFRLGTDEEVENITHNKTEDSIKYDFEDKKLLLVEDNELNRELARDIISEYGILVTEAVNGMEAVDIITKSLPNEYDLILMDIQMPIMNGYMATKAIRQLEDRSKANIPIIAMTANAFEEDKRAALDAGMNAHTSKPINVKELLDIMNEYMNKI